MKVKLANGVEIQPENEAELQMLLRNLGVPGASEAAHETPPPPRSAAPRGGQRDVEPEHETGGVAGPWDVRKVSALYAKLPELGRRILAHLALRGDMSTIALAQDLKLADVKGLGGSVAAIRKYAKALGLPQPITSTVTNDERSLVLDPSFRSAAAERRRQREEKSQQSG